MFTFWLGKLLILDILQSVALHLSNLGIGSISCIAVQVSMGGFLYGRLMKDLMRKTKLKLLGGLSLPLRLLLEKKNLYILESVGILINKYVDFGVFLGNEPIPHSIFHLIV